MPIFEYRCKDCGKVSEVLEKADSKAKHVCPHCGGSHLEKQFSTFGVSMESSTPSCDSGSCPSGQCPYV
jgi:putative FmdB family regulatory protein